MRTSLSLVLSTIVALAAAEASNPFNIPKGGYEFEAGEATNLKWEPTSDGTISLKLQSGNVLTPDGGATIASHIDNSGNYVWTPPKDIVNKPDYTIRIVDDEDPEESNYLPRFSVSGATATASTTATSTSASETSSSASATSTESSSTASPSTMTTMTSTTSSSSPSASDASDTSDTSDVSSTSAGSSAATSSGSASASSSADASSTSPSGAAETLSDTSAGMVNRVSGGMIAVVLGAMAFM